MMTEERTIQVVTLLEDLLFEFKREKEIFIDEREAARRLNLSASYLTALRSTRKGPRYIKEGSRILYRPEDLKKWADSRITQGGNNETKF